MSSDNNIPSHHEYAHIDESGNTVPLNTEGDTAVKIKPERPVGLFKEYLGNPEATAKTVRGQWYITGDR
ncbi:MAG: AMP-binding protein, partial [Nitrospirae bacterium]|nr:AMP-binding protein [Nitrospirota bacterium]